MARQRVTIEKLQRDAKKKRKAEEKRALKQKKKDIKEAEGQADNQDAPQESDEGGPSSISDNA